MTVPLLNLHDRVYDELAYHQDIKPGDDLAAFGLHDLTDRVIALVRDGELEAIVRDLAAMRHDDELVAVAVAARNWVSAHPVSGDQP